MSSSEPSAPAPGLADRYRVLLEIGRTLTGTLSQDELYRVIYRETARVLEASGFYISLYDPETDEARIVFFADLALMALLAVTVARMMKDERSPVGAGG